MKKFDVFFGQVNATCITVEAKNAESAKTKAARIYKREGYSAPTICGVQDAK